MKKLILLLVLGVMVLACKNETKSTSEENVEEINQSTMSDDTMNKAYPEDLSAVFEAHGGMDRWNSINNLCFEMDGRSGKEIHTTALKSRMAKIEHKDWSIGYDGTNVWLLQNEEDAYSGNARFYHNLMFYFYAMPFIVGDDGIQYEAVPSTELDGTMYPGIKISYEAGVGDSPEDEYIVYYDADTKQMTWLGYTVTYRSQEKSEDWHFIKYDQWQDINGLQLPKKLTWYNVEDGKPSSERNDLLFTKVTATETVLDPTVFEQPAKAVVVEK